MIASSALMSCNQWGSYLPCETPTKETGISIFITEGLKEGSNLVPLNPKLDALSTRPHGSTTWKHLIWMIKFVFKWNKINLFLVTNNISYSPISFWFSFSLLLPPKKKIYSILFDHSILLIFGLGRMNYKDLFRKKNFYTIPTL